MKKFVLLFAVIFTSALVASGVPAVSNSELSRLEKLAQNVQITRDDWGIAHVKGKTDADAVFGAIYAQAEDDFNRIETNYLNSMGRLAEAEGESAIWSDLRMKMFIDPEVIKEQYESSPAWLKALMNAWADGLNFYLATHPEVKPRVITKFEPWMPLTFSEGSIGGDIESINLAQLRGFYGGDRMPVAVNLVEDHLKEPSGSNGIAIAPANTKDGNAMLLINPHTSFFFRSELQMTSDEGLNAYGASTWGQFFIYQGFNENLGWMHTSSSVDAIDEYLETIVKKGDKYYYKYGSEERPVMVSRILIPFKTDKGISAKSIAVFRTHHGPIIRAEGDKWVSIALMNEPVKALMQSYGRTKAKDYKEFRKIMDLHANSSNNTLYADNKGNIAYFHTNYIPRRDTKFDWTKPVDGSDPATDWKGLHTVDEAPNLFNPSNGWVFCTNNWPWSAAGSNSLKKLDFPVYVDNGIENARGRHAIKVLENKKGFTLESLRAAAYDSYLTWFDKPLPALLKAYDDLPGEDSLKSDLAAQIKTLREWDRRWSADSGATSLAVFWGEEMVRKVGPAARQAGVSTDDFAGEKATGGQMLESLVAASAKLKADFGRWETPWGDINRFQRLTADIAHPFSDAGPSIPVAFTSATWGSLASFGARSYKGSKKIYGTSGNSFVAVVEFGKTVKARAVTAGGESGDPKSKHFNDQAKRYSTGDLREVYFYPEQLKGKIERQYNPGK